MKKNTLHQVLLAMIFVIASLTVKAQDEYVQPIISYDSTVHMIEYHGISTSDLPKDMKTLSAEGVYLEFYKLDTLGRRLDLEMKIRIGGIWRNKVSVASLVGNYAVEVIAVGKYRKPGGHSSPAQVPLMYYIFTFK